MSKTSFLPHLLEISPENLSKQFLEQAQEIADLRESLKESEEGLVALQEELFKKNHLTEAHEEALLEIEELKNHSSQIERAMQFLRDKIEEQKLENKDLVEQFDHSQSDFQKKITQCEQAEEENKELQLEVEKTKQILLHTLKEAKELKAHLAESAEEKAQILHRERELQGTYQQQRHDLGLVVAKLRSIDKEKGHLQESLASYQEENQKLKEELSFVKCSFETLEERFSEQEEEYKGLLARWNEMEQGQAVNFQMESLMTSLHDLLGKKS